MYGPILRNIARHIQLSEKETAFFTSLLKPRKLRRKQYLLQAGDVCRMETFVAKGCLRAYTIDDKGHEHITMLAFEDWWISDLYSFLTATPATQHIDALEDSAIFCIEKDDLETLYREVPKFERFFRVLFQNAFIAHQKRLLDSVTQTAEERYFSFLEKFPTLAQRISQHHIASYLGVTAETISRIRRQQTKRNDGNNTALPSGKIS